MGSRRKLLLLLLVCCAFASFVSAQSISITFLDEWGEQTSRVLEHSKAILRVIDPGADVSSGPDSVPVDLSATISMDSGFIDLVETGDSTGVFEGEVDLTTDFYLNYLEDPDHLYTQPRTYVPVSLDTANATYNGVTGSAEAAPSLIELMQVDGDLNPASFAMGESVRVRIRDQYSDLSSGRDSTTMSFSSSGGDAEYMTALETGARTGVFEAILPIESSGGGLVYGDGKIQAAVGETFSVLHADANGFSSSTDSATVAAASVAFLDRLENRPTDVYVEGGAVVVRVVDLAADTDPIRFDEVAVGLSMLLSGDGETLTLRETGPATGVFEGWMSMRVGYQYSGNQLLESQDVTSPPQFDTATVTYGSLTDSATLTGSIVHLLDEWGGGIASVAPGSILRIRVQTHNQKSSGTVDFADVEILTQTELEVVRLWETSPISGVFEGEVRIGQGLGSPGDNQVQAQAGQTLRVEHADTNGVTRSGAEAAVVRSALRFVDGDGQPMPVLLEQAPALVQILDMLSAGQPPPAASIKSRLAKDLETLSAIEVAGSSGLFEASIPVVSGYQNPGNGNLEVSIGTFPVNHPDLVTAESNGASVQAITAPAILEIVNDQGLPIDTAGPGATLRVRVVSPRENTSAVSPNTFYAMVTSRVAGDMEYLSLVETGPNTSVFEATFPIFYSEGYAEPSAELYVRSRDTVVVTYDPPNYPYSSDDDLVVDRVEIVPALVELVDSQGSGVSTYLLGETVHLRAFEAGANGDPGTAETLAVKVQAWRRTDARPDLETVILTETGPDTAVFAGSLTTQVTSYSSMPTWDNGVLEIPDYDPYGFGDLTTVTASRGDATDSAQVKDSEVRFTDASDQDVEIYSIGSMIHVRLLRPVADTSPGADTETVEVWTRTDYSVDLETVVLTETGGATGLFAGSIPTVAQAVSTSGNGVLEAEAGFVIEVDKRASYSLRSFDLATLMQDGGNLPPDAVDDIASTAEDTAVTISVRSNDTDPDGDPLAITGLGQGLKGVAAINAGSTVTYTPYANANGSDTFTYTISDGRGGSDTATVAVTIAPVNDAPQAVTDYATTTEDTPVTLAVKDNDTDIDGDALSVIAVGQGTKGSVVIDAGGTVTYTPNANATGSDYFSYTVSDSTGGPGGTAIGTVMMTIAGLNDPPDAVNDTVSTNEDTAVTVQVRSNDTDPDGNALTITAVTQGTKGSVAINAGTSVIYTPIANANGSDTFTYTISDGQGGTDTATVFVTINPVNDVPKANADSVTTNEDTPVTLDPRVNDTDVDGDSLTITFVSQPNRGSAAINVDGTVTYTPTANVNGPDQFLYTIVDGNGGTWSAIVSVSVTPVNDPPDAFGDLISTQEDTPITISVLSNDTDREGNSLTVTAVTQPAQGTAEINNGTTITYTPNLNTNGTDSFTYTISDGNGGSDTATVYMSIYTVNDPPVAVNDSATVDEDGSVILSVRDNDTDPEGSTLTVSAVTQGAHGLVTIVNNGTQVRYLPVVNYSGPDTFTYTIRDPGNLTSVGTVSVTVNGINDAPVAVNDSVTTNEDTPLTIPVRSNDTDIEGDTLTITAVTQGTRGSVSINAGATVTYTPHANANGSDSFSYTISDGNGGTSTGTVTVTINPVNDPPLAVDDIVATSEDVSIAIPVLANDSDVDGGALSVISVTQGANGGVTTNGSTVTYTPAANINGADAFTYTVSDGVGGTATATVTVAITAVNDAPATAPDSGATRENVPVIIPVLANDTDAEGNPLTVTFTSTPPNGATSRQPDNTVIYYPHPNFTGMETFTYTVSDGQGGTSVGQVTVVVGEALERVAVLATNSVALRTSSDVLSGDVIVNQAGAGPFLNGAELSVGGPVTTASNYDVEGDSVTVAAGAVISSDVRYNELTNSGTINGLQTSPLPLPVFSALPPFLAATPGTTNVSVGTNGNRTLAAGSYQDLVVGRKATVTFTGGVYHFRTITVDREAKLYFSAASEVRVQQKLSTKNLTTIGPAVGAAIDASSILLYVAGINGTSGALTATPKTVEIGVDNTFKANLYAPNGTILLQDRTQAIGAFLGKDIDVGPDAQVSLDSAFSGGQ